MWTNSLVTVIDGVRMISLDKWPSEHSSSIAIPTLTLLEETIYHGSQENLDIKNELVSSIQPTERYHTALIAIGVNLSQDHRRKHWLRGCVHRLLSRIWELVI